MYHHPVAMDGSPLERIVAAVRGWDDAPVDPGHWTGLRGADVDPGRVVIEQAKGAVMFRYGVNSHVALGILACWSRGLDIPIGRLAEALAHGVSGDPVSA